jgi:glycosyltransferase involved in cell wall biosynthesis
VTSTPLVSVCIPVRNGEKLLGATLESVLAQDLDDFELVVSDNASTDATVAVVEEMADPRVRLLRGTEDIGGIANWNRVAAQARGRYLKLLAADDLLYPGCLSAQAAVLEDPAHRDVVMVACRRDLVDDTGRRLGPARGLGRLSGQVPAREAVRATVRAGTNLFGEPHCVLFRTEALPPEGAFVASRSYMVDLDLYCRLLRTGDVYALRRTLAAFRVHAGAESVRVARHQSAQADRLFRDLEEQGWVSAADRRLGSARAVALSAARRGLYRGLELRRRVGGRR